MNIVGFDPGSLRNIGWSCVDLTKTKKKIKNWSSGTFVNPVTPERWQVLWPMSIAVDAFLEIKQPDLVILEQTSSFSGGFVTGQVSQCMGVILMICAKYELKVDFVYPTSVKKVVAGHGRAKKAAIKKSVKELLEKAGVKNTKFDSEHAADATSLILYWMIKNEIMPPLDKE